MKEQMIVREATAADVPQLLEFEQGIVTAERPFNPALKDGEIHYYDLAALVADPDAGVFVGEIDGVAVASGSVRIRIPKPYLRHEREAYLGFMYVRPEFRGKGLNRQILTALIDWARERGLEELTLNVYAGNAGAIRAYEKAGFESHLIEMRMNIGDTNNV